ncbi:HK97-gp10 family putative phage morphogenesis protein [Microbispora amethystogenes]|uniref:HK97-gp10 family putative phage morphogenesis protein n=1 Tax=Microbispora amethystogenes TaxID=1427754 RepID=UPI0033FDD889
MTGLDFEGIDEINRLAFDLGRLGFAATAKVAKVARSTGERTVAGAQAIVPVLTGNLKGTIGVDFDPDGLGFEAGPTASYAPYVEHGTSRMAPRAFMGPAFDRAIADGVEALGEVLGRDLL